MIIIIAVFIDCNTRKTEWKFEIEAVIILMKWEANNNTKWQ